MWSPGRYCTRSRSGSDLNMRPTPLVRLGQPRDHLSARLRRTLSLALARDDGLDPHILRRKVLCARVAIPGNRRRRQGDAGSG